MLREFFVPLVTLVVCMGFCVCCINQLCEFHHIYLGMAAQLESERWLVTQCDDPHFFSNMHSHTDLCFTVSDHARVGALMLALQEFTRRLLDIDLFGGRLDVAWWIIRALFSWTGAAMLAFLLVFGPSWVFCGARAMGRQWPSCTESHFKDV